jgi:glycosyltransferase involved in cell wall biosynthesis
MASVCLNMIVKNEARVVERCLDSVRPFITTWVIVDTGSTDDTQAIVRGKLAELPGALHERPWKNFGHNRTEALRLAEGKAEYALIMDADEVLEVPPGFAWPHLIADQYRLMHRHRSSPETTWELGTLVRLALPWRYEGVLHEGIVCDAPHRAESLRGPIVWGYFDSARNVDPVAKYENDAKILEAALVDEPKNARYVFYLAQSYRDCGKLKEAIAAYERRVAMGGWGEEVYFAQCQVGTLGNRLGWDWSRVLDAYLRAYELRRCRAESLCACASHYRLTQEWGLAELFARAAVAIPRPADLLFVDDAVYSWRALDELAIATYYVGKRDESRALNERLLSEGHLPATERPRIEQNLSFSLR